MIRVNLNEIKKRKLDNFFLAMYIVKYPVPYKKDNLVENRDLYVIYGININGKRKIIDIIFNKFNDNRFWLEQFEDIKNRNVENVMFLVTSYDKNIVRAMKIVYNDTAIIGSAIDIINDFNRFVSSRRSSDIGEILKKLFLAEDIDKYYVELELIKEKYKDFKIIIIVLNRHLTNIEAYYTYCKEIRRLLFPYYSLRDMQLKIRKIGNSVEYFADIEGVITLMLDYVNSFENGRSNNKKEWLELLDILYKDYQEKIERYI